MIGVAQGTWQLVKQRVYDWLFDDGIDPLQEAAERLIQAQLDIVRLVEEGYEPRTVVVSIRRGGTDTIVLSEELTPEDIWLAIEARKDVDKLKESLNRR